MRLLPNQQEREMEMRQTFVSAEDVGFDPEDNDALTRITTIAEDQYPWALVIMPCDSGWWLFESSEDSATWENQK